MATRASGVQDHEHLKMLILPTGTFSKARICTLAHPRTAKPSRYYFCPDKGVFEFTRVAAPRCASRSWLLASQIRPSKSTLEDGHTLFAADDDAREYKAVSEGYVVKLPELLVATPIDPLFLLLPSLQSQKLFLSADDILDGLCDTSKHFKFMSNDKRTRGSLDERMEVVCDMVEAGAEKMYRLSIQKLLKELLLKSKAMVTLGLPTSMEDRFIQKALETPIVGLKREQSSLSDAIAASQGDTSVLTPVPSEATDSQLSASISESAASESSAQTNLTLPDEDPVPIISDGIKHLLQIRTALSFMISAYVPASLEVSLHDHLSSAESPINFQPLDEQLARIAKMRVEVLSSRSLSDFSRKRSMDEDDEAADTRAEKKRKKEEEEKRKKAGESRGLRDLKKVDVSGMRKMSDFFGRGTPTKKKK